METILVESEEAGIRIDVYLNTNMNELSRSQIQRLIENGLVLVNQKPCKSNYKIRLGDLIETKIPEPEEMKIEAEDIPLSILYEDKDLIVVNKEQGMVVHPAPGHFNGTLVNALLFHCGKELSGINGMLRPGIVHRIDKDTSGILVVAKTNIAHQSLAKQLAEHSITRKYHALVFNQFQEKEGTVNQPIGRNPLDRKKMAVTKKHSRHAVTHYTVLEGLGKFAYIEARLETGRTHQIRVHMSYIGHPLLGDPVYGPKKQPLTLQGQSLHAKVLGFVHPATGEYMEFQTELPNYFLSALEKIRNFK